MSAVARLEDALREHGCKGGSGNWTCPAHEDSKPSLSVTEGRDGRVLVNCHAGCETSAIVEALGITLADLFDAPAAARASIVAEYDYVDETGELLFQVVRFAPKDFRQRRPDPEQPGEWAWKLQGVRRVPYRLPAIVAAVAAGRTIYICEGEKDVHAIEKADGVATCNPGGAGNWLAEFAECLRGARVIVVAHRDEPGRRHAAKVAASLAGIAASVVVEAATGNDAADHLAAGFGLDAFVPMAEQEPAEPAAVVRFVPLGEYVAHPKGSPDTLLGAGDDVLLPVGGLMMPYGDAGAGKTTFDVDAVAHLASGTDWLGIPVARPVKIALIQNEGPAEPWRRKLERKLETWTGEPWRENVLVLDEPHGGFDFRIPEHREAIRELRRQGVELIVADPTKWLGAEGGGTPAEVREFVALLKECGLHAGDPAIALAFWLAHHENKAGEISGAWRADPDTLVHVEGDGQGRTKVTFEKCRWSSSRQGQRMILAWATGEGYEVIETPDRPTLSGEDVDAQVLAFVIAEASEDRRPGMRKVREAVAVRSERVDEGLERLKERGEITDLDRKGCPHPGTPGTPRYWIPRSHAGSEGVRPVGTPPDTFDFEPQDGERVPGGGVPVSRTRGGHLPPDTFDGAASTGDDNPRCSTCGKRRRRTEAGEPTCHCEETVEPGWRDMLPDTGEDPDGHPIRSAS